MKIHITCFSLILSVVPFAFWKMDGVFGQVVNKEKEASSQVIIRKLTGASKVRKVFLKPNKKNDIVCFKNLFRYIYLYNYQTGYSIGYVCDDRVESIKDFLIGKKIRSFPHGLSDTKFYFCKEKPGIVQTDITKPTEGIKLCSYLSGRGGYKPLNLQKNPVKSKKEFDTRSGVKIVNQDNRVEIKRGEETFDFQKALIDYYHDDDFNFGQKGKTVEKSREIPNIGKHELKRLINSTILSVYAVIKNDKGKNSIIWGLAQDNTTENREKFHWITDLGCDISFLIK